MSLGAYLIKLEIGNVGMPGAPILHVVAVVNASTGVISGSAEITQALPPPNGEIAIPHITGQVRHTGLGGDQLLVTLEGEFVVSFPPPAIGSYLARFSAGLVVDKAWNGHGSYTYNHHTVDNVPVKSL